jgi:hypothetical protein
MADGSSSLADAGPLSRVEPRFCLLRAACAAIENPGAITLPATPVK